MNRWWRPIGLQGWLVVGFVGVGMIASLAILLVLLPTLESAVRDEQAPRERAALLQQVIKIGQDNRLSANPTPQELRELAASARTDLGGEVRIVFYGSPLSVPLIVQAPRSPTLLNRFPAASGQAQSTHSDWGVWASAPLYGGDFVAGSITAAHPVRGVAAELAIVRRRAFIAMLLVLSLASLLGFALSRVIGRRIARLAQTASTLAGGDLSARAPAMAPAELDTLSASLNGMAARLEGLVAEITSERDRDRAMLGSLAEGVLAVSAAGEVTVANRAAERYLGLTDASGTVPLEALPPELIDAVRAALAEAGGAVAEHEMTVAGCELDVHVARLGGERAAGAVVTLRDVTEERRLERARRDLVANVSHELKTPIAALKGFLELLEGDGVSERHRQEFIASMSQETARLERLVEEQLQLARLDSGGLPLEREEVDLRELASQVVAPRAVLAARDGVTLVRLLPAAPVTVHADPARVEQVLLILLDNALRHTPAGGRVEVSVGRDDGAATLSVRDTGTGIPAEEQPFVFDRFYRGDASREGRSAGLGLAIARGLAAAHGGAIDLVSAPGQGSTFTLLLPMPAPPEPAVAGAGGPPGRPGRLSAVTTPTALVTGAGRGIGRAAVDALLEAGWQVVAGVRDPAVAAELGAGGPDRLLAIELDVTRPEHVRRAVEAAVRMAGGPLDCLVNNAGYGVYGPVEDVDLGAAREMFETNLFGAAALIQAVLPGMREAGRGAIVNVSSIGAHFANPLVGMYHASKHALHGLSEALALECRPFGVRVVMVEPGMVATGFSAAVRRTGALTAEGGPYAGLAGSLRESFTEWRRRYEVTPERVARAIVRAATDGETPFRVIVGEDAALLARERAAHGPDAFHDALVAFLAIDLPRRPATPPK